MLYRAAIALVLCLAQEGHALSLPALTRSARLPSVARASVLTCAEDPTGNPFIQAINGLQEAIQNSPAAKFKKGLAKLQAGDYDEIAMRAQLDGIIAGDRVVLDGYGAEYRVVELNEVHDGYALRAELANLTGRTSVPAVFIGGEFVGGCNDGGLGGVMTLDKAGKLQPMLQA